MRIATHLIAFLAGAATMLVAMILDAVMPVYVRRKPEPFEEPYGDL